MADRQGACGLSLSFTCPKGTPHLGRGRRESLKKKKATSTRRSRPTLNVWRRDDVLSQRTQASLRLTSSRSKSTLC